VQITNTSDGVLDANPTELLKEIRHNCVVHSTVSYIRVSKKYAEKDVKIVSV